MPMIPSGANKAATPKLVNRGPAGLLAKQTAAEPATPLTDEQQFLAELLSKHPDAGSFRASPDLEGMAVLIADLTPDPNNARKHPERNTRAIMGSLAAHGQVKPLVVRRQGMIVMAGNGTMEAARRLGWTTVAVSVTDMTEAEAAAYGLADNRTAELATWDFAVVSRLEKLISEAGGEMVGWSMDELAALRIHDYTPPPEDFPEVDEGIEIEHTCPKCGYRFSGGEVTEVNQGEVE